MVVIFKSALLDCSIDSTMTSVKIDALARETFIKIMRNLNAKFTLNASNFDGILEHVDGSDYALVSQYRDQFNFLFVMMNFGALGIHAFSSIIEQATSYNIEIIVNN